MAGCSSGLPWSTVSPNGSDCGLLLLFLDVQRVLAKLGRVLLHPQLFATGLPPQRVVGVSGLFADEVHHFEFLFAFGHLNEPSSRGLNIAKARRPPLIIPKFWSISTGRKKQTPKPTRCPRDAAVAATEDFR